MSMKGFISLRLTGALVTLSSIFFLSNSSNPPTGYTGAPFNSNCNSCHSGGNFGGSVSINGLPATIQPNTLYSLDVTVTGSSPGAGFELVAVDGSNANCGMLTAGPQSGTEATGGRTYLEQRGTKTMSGGSAVWTFSWRSPLVGVPVAGNQVKFYVAGNLVDGSGTSGDEVVNSNEVIDYAAASALSASITSTDPVSCFGGSDGSAVVTAMGGSGVFTYQWSNGQSGPTAVNLTAGNYTVTVISGAATATATATITQPTALNANSTGGTLTCANPAINITASASGGIPPYSFSWSNGATTATTQVNTPGLYSAIVTDINGCTKTTSVNVLSSITPPSANAGPSQVLSGAGTAILNATTGTSAGSQYSYLWTTSGGNIVSGVTTLMPLVNAAGVYTLQVTNTQNGCTSTSTTQVTAAATIPVAEAGSNFTVTCSTSLPVTLNGEGSSTGIEFAYQWSTTNGNISAGAQTLTPTITSGGTYGLLVTNVLSGSTASDAVVVTYNTQAPTNLNATGGTITCSQQCVNINATSVGSTIVWQNPSGVVVGNSATYSACTPGIYTAIATGSNGCTSSTTVTVSLDNTVVPAGISPANPVLTCSSSTIILQASPTGNNYTYAWSVTANTQANLSVNTAATYTVTVTQTANGCSSTASINVGSNTAAPGASITPANPSLSCTQSSINLQGQTNATGATFAWAGPNNLSSSTQNIAATVAGTYTLTVTGTNGCSSTSTVSVAGNANVPQVSIASGGGALNCIITSLVLNATSTTPGLNYSWTGPNNFTSNVSNPTIQQPGFYTVVAINPANSCSSSANVTITQDLTAPSVTAQGGTILCNSAGVMLSANGNPQNVLYLWTGPNSYSSSSQNPMVNTQGAYTVVVTHPQSGCTASTTVQVNLDNSAPVLNMTKTNDITCLQTSSEICASAPGTSAITWSGPNGFSSNQACFTTAIAGVYTATALGNNGCQTQSSITLVANNGAPQLTVLPATLTCLSVALHPLSYASSATPGTVITYNPVTEIITATAPNGCTAAQNFVVTSDINPPGLTVTGGELTCTNTSVTLTATSSTPNVTYLWSNGSTAAQITVIIAGTYSVVVTNPANGCTSAGNAQASQNVQVPTCTADGGTLSCTNSAVSLVASSTTPNTTFAWFGANGPLPNPIANAPGTYTVVVTALNGCTSTCTATVTSTSTFSFSYTATVNCNGTYALNPIFAGGAAPYAFNVAGDPQALPAGTYAITATDASGCTVVSTIELAPVSVLSVALNQVIIPTNGANNGAIQITVTNGTLPLSYVWTNAAGLIVSTLEDPTNFAEGAYHLLVTDANGCTTQLSDIVLLSVGTESAQQLQSFVRIFPNPADYQVNITCQWDTERLERVEVLDQAGRVILTELTSNTVAVLDTYQLGAALYTIRIVTKSGFVLHQRLIVQH
jgi:hypothetical protein